MSNEVITEQQVSEEEKRIIQELNWKNHFESCIDRDCLDCLIYRIVLDLEKNGENKNES